jgi:hypothetical protein
MSAREKTNTERVNTFLSVEIRCKLEDEAKKKGTTLSGLLRMIAIEHVNENEQKK